MTLSAPPSTLTQAQPKSTLSATDMRDAYIGRLYDVAVADPRIILLSNDFGAPSLDRFRRDRPAQFINAAISEQNMVSVAAGMALEGRLPIIYSIATFITLRALEQIKIDVCAMKLPVTILAVGTGYAYSVDGPTHHATEDMALMRSMAGMTIYSPSEPSLAAALADTLPATSGPTYVRLDRGKWPVVAAPNAADLAAGHRHLRAGRDVVLVATGGMVHRALEVATALEQAGIAAGVLDLFRLKPLDTQALADVLRTAAAVATIEEHTLHGGLGGLVAELMADQRTLKPLHRHAIADNQLYTYGERPRLHAERGLDARSLAESIRLALGPPATPKTP